MVFVEILTFIFAVTMLVKGSDFFVQSASDIATKLGASQLIVGLTIVAVGTSLPELAAAVSASLQDAPALIIGNIVGSNIANIGLIAAIAVIVHQGHTNKRILMRDGYVMLFAAALLYMMSIDGAITITEGIIMTILYGAYLIFVIETRSEEDEKEYHFTKFFQYVLTFKYISALNGHAKKMINTPWGEVKEADFTRDVIIIIMSGAAVIYGAKFAIQEAIYFATLLNVPQSVIGVTLVAIGTSLPELSVALAAARKGLVEIVIGNVIGSNIANILLIGGVASIIKDIPVGDATLLYTAPVMIGVTILYLIFMRTAWKVERWEGVVLLHIYIAFIALIALNPVWAG